MNAAAPCSSPAPWPSLAEHAADYRQGRTSALATTQECLRRIRALDPHLGAFVEVYEDEALAAAEAADAMLQAGHWLGPLHGVPVAIKDLVDIAGKATTWGCAFRREALADVSAPLVHTLLAAGAVIVGKTHLVQFALGAWGLNEFMGTPRNPWGGAQHLSPGGSSSGSAVAVAAGMVPLAIGTDTGGSVRVPAALCGITGHKPTWGLVDARGVAALSPTLDSVGVFATRAIDALALMQVLAEGQALGRPGSAPAAPQGDPLQPFAGLRMGCLGAADLQGVAPDVLDAYASALTVFEQAGAQVVETALPTTFEDFAETASRIMLAEGALLYGDLARDESLPIDRTVRPRLLAGTELPATAYLQARRHQAFLKDRFAAQCDRLDVLLTPAAPTTAQSLQTLDPAQAPIRYTRIFNLLQRCGVSVPAGLDRQGLPMGLQIAGMRRGDADVLRIAAEFQKLTPFHEARWPAWET